VLFHTHQGEQRESKQKRGTWRVGEEARIIRCIATEGCAATVIIDALGDQAEGDVHFGLASIKHGCGTGGRLGFFTNARQADAYPPLMHFEPFEA
jgi:hypothetical protein